MINIVLCDDHEIVRKGLRQLLQEQPGFCVLDDVSSGEMLLAHLRKIKPDVIIIDIALAGRSGLEVIKQLKLLYPKIKVLVLSMYPEEQVAIRAVKAGAFGYLHKDSPPEELAEAIRTVAGGDKYVSRKMMSLLFSEVASKTRNNSLKNLSDREYEILILLSEGKKVSDIARQLSLSVKTVSTYKKRISEKLNLRSVAEMARYVAEHKLHQPAFFA